MKKVEVYITSDGKFHQTYARAQAYAEKRYGDHLTRMAHALVAIEKYTDMVDHLNNYHGAMQHLLEISKDRELEDEE